MGSIWSFERIGDTAFLIQFLLQQPTGLTAVVGGNEGLRNWLITTFGHASLTQGPQHRLVCGIDRHRPDWFVPVGGIIYINSLRTETPSADSIQKAWARCGKRRRCVATTSSH